MTSAADQFTQPARPVPTIEKTGGMPIGVDRPHKGRYYDPNTDTSYQRVSNLLKFIDGDRYNLERWFERMVALGLSVRPDLLLGVAALGPDGDKGKLNELCQQAKDAAGGRSGANKGTALHAATERLDRGEHIENIILPPPFDVDLRAYRDLVHSAGFVKHPDMIERSVGRPADNYMGTTDRAAYYRDAQGVLSIVDVKTERDPTYNWVHIAAQLAAYANATHIWDDGKLVPLSGLGLRFNTDVGWIVHVRDGAAILHAIDLRAGWRLVQAAMYLRATFGASGELAREVPVAIEPPPTAGIVAAAVAQGPNGYAPAAATTDTDVDTHNPLNDPALTGQAPTGLTAAPTFSGQVTIVEMLLDEVRLADSRDRLSELYEIAQQHPGVWTAVELDAMLRGQIVGCPQRAMHNPSTTGRCACGWTPEHRP